MGWMGCAARSVPHGFSNFARWAGRDSRALFWPYLLLILVAASTMSSLVGEIAGLLLPPPRAACGVACDWARIMQLRAVGQIAFLAVVLILGGAAIIRRLHDIGRSGWWLGVLAGVELSRGLMIMVMLGLAASGSANFATSFGAVSGLFLLASVVLHGGMIVMLAWPTSTQDNRYGHFMPSDEDRLRWAAHVERSQPERNRRFRASDWELR